MRVQLQISIARLALGVTMKARAHKIGTKKRGTAPATAKRGSQLLDGEYLRGRTRAGMRSADRTAVDARSEIFAVGVVLHEMLTGNRAFQKATAVETMTANPE